MCIHHVLLLFSYLFENRPLNRSKWLAKQVIVTEFVTKTISSYWTRLSKISWFVSGEQVNYLNWQITIFCDNRVQQLLYHSITEFVFSMNILGKRSDLPFSRKSDRKKEKSVVSFMHEQNSICSQKQLNDIAHEHTIICRQLFAGHVVGSLPVKRK